MKFSDAHRLVAFWRSVVIDDRIKALEAKLTPTQITDAKKAVKR